MKKVIRLALWGVFVLSTIAIAYYAFSYFDFNVKNLLHAKGELVNRRIYQIGFYGHIFFGARALLIGPWQFMQGIRTKKMSLHRLLGKAYVAACIFSGLAGLYIAQYASTGMVARLGFSALAILWLFTTIRAFTSIRQLKVVAHQMWMFRSYALTFAAVTLRIQLGISEGLGLDFDVAYPLISWSCWVPNLVLVELIWVQKMKKPKFV